jgi:Peptidase family M28
MIRQRMNIFTTNATWPARFLTALLASGSIFGGVIATEPKIQITPDQKEALASISIDSLKSNLSFLASDELKGRFTPSPELDIAARFIASQFMRAGLEPAGNDGYFQVVDMIRRTNGTPSSLTARKGEAHFVIPAASVSVQRSVTAVHLENAPAVFVPAQTPESLANLNISGKVVISPRPDFAAAKDADRMKVFEQRQAFSKALDAQKPAALITIGRAPRRPILLFADEAEEMTKNGTATSVWISGDETEGWVKALKESPQAFTVSLDVGAPQDEKLQLRNVVGILRGSDPKLKETAVMVSAHYDHIGTVDTGINLGSPKGTDKDKIYNGANDDGSGTVSVIEIGAALAKLKIRPKRSILFVTFFGEEVGGFGSRYFGLHPPIPVFNIVGDVNLEQVGRTDSSKGPEVANASLTGYDYSDLTKYMERAGAATGIRVYLDKEASDPFFMRSDNATLASRGVPAHSLTTAFVYPDYHGVGDEWQKIDYSNMAKVDRMVALGLITMANSSKPPQWNDKNPKVKTYIEAQKAEAVKAKSAK